MRQCVFVVPGRQVCSWVQAALCQEPCQAGMLQKQAALAPDQHWPGRRCRRSWKCDCIILVAKEAWQVSSAATFCWEDVQETAGSSPADLSQALVLVVADFKNKSLWSGKQLYDKVCKSWQHCLLVSYKTQNHGENFSISSEKLPRVLPGTSKQRLWVLIAVGLPTGAPLRQHPTIGKEAEQHHSPCPPSKAAVRTGSQPLLICC